MNINHFESVHMLITVVSALTPVQGIILRKHHKVSNVVLDDGIQSLTSFFFPSSPSSRDFFLPSSQPYHDTRERQRAYIVSLRRL